MGDFATLRELCKFRTYYFPVKVQTDSDFDMRRVNPYKQRVVATILDDLKNMPWITEAWLFGSSIQPYCKYESDTDIAFRLDSNMVDKLCKDDNNFYWLYPINERDCNGTDFINLDNVHPYCELMYNIKHHGVKLK